MKKSAIIVLVIFCGLNFPSCRKYPTVSFKGEVLSDKTKQPFKSYTVILFHDYPGDTHSYESFGSTTNNSGTFEIRASIKRYDNETFYYSIFDNSKVISYDHFVDANTNGEFQTIYYPSTCAIRFHIKNVNPINSNDEFIEYLATLDTTFGNLPEYLNFHGMNIDKYRIKSPFYGHNKLVYYNYGYRKDGIYYIAHYDTIRTNGEDTVDANIFY